MDTIQDTDHQSEEFRWQVMDWAIRVESDDAEASELLSMLGETEALEDESMPSPEYLESLTPRQLGAVVLTRVYGLYAATAAEVSGITESAVASRLQEAKKGLPNGFTVGDKQKNTEEVASLPEFYAEEGAIQESLRKLLKDDDSFFAFRSLRSDEQLTLILIMSGYSFEQVSRAPKIQTENGLGLMQFATRAMQRMKARTLKPEEGLPAHYSADKAIEFSRKLTSHPDYSYQVDSLTPSQRAAVEMRAQGHRVVDIGRTIGIDKRIAGMRLREGLSRLDSQIRGVPSLSAGFEQDRQARELMSDPEHLRELLEIREDHRAVFISRALGLAPTESKKLLGFVLHSRAITNIKRYLNSIGTDEEFKYPTQPVSERLYWKANSINDDTYRIVAPRLSVTARVIVGQVRRARITHHKDLYPGFSEDQLSIDGKRKHATKALEQLDMVMTDPDVKTRYPLGEPASRYAIVGSLANIPSEKIQQIIKYLPERAGKVVRHVLETGDASTESIQALFGGIDASGATITRQRAILQLWDMLADRYVMGDDVTYW